MEQQKKEMDTSKLRGMFEGAHIENCTQNFIWDNEVVNVYGKDAMKEEHEELTDEVLRNKINQVLPMMQGKGNQRKWFCIAKVLMLRGLVVNGDFDAAGKFIRRLYPNGLSPDYDARDLARLHTGTFMLPINFWNPNDAPVTRPAEFNQYLQLAKSFNELFTK